MGQVAVADAVPGRTPHRREPTLYPDGGSSSVYAEFKRQREMSCRGVWRAVMWRTDSCPPPPDLPSFLPFFSIQKERRIRREIRARDATPRRQTAVVEKTCAPQPRRASTHQLRIYSLASGRERRSAVPPDAHGTGTPLTAAAEPLHGSPTLFDRPHCSNRSRQICSTIGSSKFSSTRFVYVRPTLVESRATRPTLCR